MAQHSLVGHGLWGQEAGWTASTPVGIPASLPRGVSWGLSEHLLQCLAAGLSYRRTGQDQGRHADRSMDPTILFQSQGSWPSSQLGSNSEKMGNSPKVSWSWTRTLTPDCAPTGRLALVKAEVGSVKGEGEEVWGIWAICDPSTPSFSPVQTQYPGEMTAKLTWEKSASWASHEVSNWKRKPHYLDRKGWAESATCRRLVSPPTRVLPAIPTNHPLQPEHQSPHPSPRSAHFWLPRSQLRRVLFRGPSVWGCLHSAPPASVTINALYPPLPRDHYPSVVHCPSPQPEWQLRAGREGP